MKVTAIILTKDAEQHVSDCLQSVQWVDEILVIDSESTDQTVVLAQKLGARIIINPWPGFSAQRNFALDKATNEWILMLDVDERITSELASEMQIALQTAEDTEIVGFSTPIKNHFWGKWMRCWYPDRRPRLYKKSKARFIERAIHESVNLDGKVKKLKNPVIHFSYENLSHFVSKMNHYSSLGAQEKLKQGAEFSTVKLLLHSFYAFFKMYILRGGCRDGVHGFVFAVSYSFYVFLKYAKLRPEENMKFRRL